MSSFADEAKEAIRETGGRFTAQRQLIVELLEEAEGHPNAEQLYQLAHQRDESVSLATVYRTLNVLAEAGLLDLRYFPSDHEHKHYELVTEEEHYHFTCRECRQVIEFESELVDAVKRELEARMGVSAFSACVCIEGLCPVCRAKNNQEVA